MTLAQLASLVDVAAGAARPAEAEGTLTDLLAFAAGMPPSG